MNHRGHLLLGSTFLLFAILGAMVWRPASAQEPGAAAYVGASVCIDCHADQGARWTATKHARSHLLLGTGYAELIDRRARGMVFEGHGGTIAAAAETVGNETDCQSCHGTLPANDPPPDPPPEETFHIEDGVQCETCHGPGSLHVAVYEGATTQSGGPAAAGQLRRMALTDCTTLCHRNKPSHAVANRKPLDPERAWPEIAHPLAEK